MALDNELRKKIYYADKDERIRIADENPSTGVKAEALGYKRGLVADSTRAKQYLSEIMEGLPQGAQVSHKIKYANLLRLEGDLPGANQMIDPIEKSAEGKSEEAGIQISKRDLFELYWLKALINSKSRDKFREYTKKAIATYQEIPEGSRDIDATDMYVCTQSWLGVFKYMDGLQQRWNGDESKANESFRESEAALRAAVDLCEKYGIGRQDDSFIHLSILHAYGFRNYDVSMDYLDRAGRIDRSKAELFGKIIQPVCDIGRGREPEALTDTDMQNISTNNALLPITKVELPRILLDYYRTVCNAEEYGKKLAEVRSGLLPELTPNTIWPGNVRDGIKLLPAELFEYKPARQREMAFGLSDR